MPSSSATQTAVTLSPAVEVLPVAPAMSYYGPRDAGPPADYSEEYYPKNTLMMAAFGTDCDEIGEKERSPSPALVTTG